MSTKRHRVIDLTECSDEGDELSKQQQTDGGRTPSSQPQAPSHSGYLELMAEDTPFQLLKIRDGAISAEFNRGCLGADFSKLTQGEGLQYALVCNFQVDLPWLLHACPGLQKAQHLMICHGEKGGERRAAIKEYVALMRGQLPGGGSLELHSPYVPNFGTHHSKAFMLQFQHGLRVIIHTANMVESDCTVKTQSVWSQDFPLKDSQSAQTSSMQFGLTDYFRHLKMPSKMEKRVLDMLQRHDLSSSRAALVASVPGSHMGHNLYKYGHMRVRDILSKETLPQSDPHHLPHSHHLVLQGSSLGSLDSKWLMQELNTSMSAMAGVAPGNDLIKDSHIHLVWPTVQEVRDSIEGWLAGCSIPGLQQNVSKTFLQPHLCRFGGKDAGRQRAMPHIKSYGRFQGQQLSWVMQGSHNLSKAAWGRLVKANTQLVLLSYELSTLHTPSMEAAYRTHRHHGFSCTEQVAGPRTSCATTLQPTVQFWTLAEHMRTQHDSTGRGVATASGPVSSMPPLRIPVPLPYSLPPQDYRPEEDKPWMVDVLHPGRDCYGHTMSELFGVDA